MSLPPAGDTSTVTSTVHNVTSYKEGRRTPTPWRTEAREAEQTKPPTPSLALALLVGPASGPDRLTLKGAGWVLEPKMRRFWACSQNSPLPDGGQEESSLAQAAVPIPA